jgi:hypothetical protein
MLANDRASRLLDPSPSALSQQKLESPSKEFNFVGAGERTRLACWFQRLAKTDFWQSPSG